MGQTYTLVVDLWMLDLQLTQAHDLVFQHKQLERARVRAKYTREVGTRCIIWEL